MTNTNQPSPEAVEAALNTLNEHAALCLNHTAAGAVKGLMVVPSQAKAGIGADLSVGDVAWRTHTYKGRTVLSCGVVSRITDKGVAYASGPDGSGILAAPDEPVHHMPVDDLLDLADALSDALTAHLSEQEG